MMKHPGIGGTEVKPETNEAIAEISPNRTLFAESLTLAPSLKPEIVKGLHHIAAVFAHYKPSVPIDFTGPGGERITEVLTFQQMADFGVSGITAQSDFLRALALRRELYLQVIRHLGSNKVLRMALADDAARKSLLVLIQQLLEEL
ncbi:MAG: hypothetical protein JO154_11540 [Chitinophaga sp.]|uniref:hypothetical protein n=1 Tax=Chitinophaga sp. TaxID=1869181 RepID=UPI0025B8B76F|nr:hypothetical protein [Chitinophaga sp.]MBV8253230.1 hypothetical protein [Chitinophaga sp.]